MQGELDRDCCAVAAWAQQLLAPGSLGLVLLGWAVTVASGLEAYRPSSCGSLPLDALRALCAANGDVKQAVLQLKKLNQLKHLPVSYARATCCQGPLPALPPGFRLQPRPRGMPAMGSAIVAELYGNRLCKLGSAGVVLGCKDNVPGSAGFAPGRPVSGTKQQPCKLVLPTQSLGKPGHLCIIQHPNLSCKAVLAYADSLAYSIPANTSSWWV